MTECYRKCHYEINHKISGHPQYKASKSKVLCKKLLALQSDCNKVSKPKDVVLMKYRINGLEKDFVLNSAACKTHPECYAASITQNCGHPCDKS